MATVYYYFKTDGVNDGTKAVGGESALCTTAFDAAGNLANVSDYYASIDAIHTGNTVTSEDFILGADTHLMNYNLVKTLTFIGDCKYRGVDVNNPNTYKAGASESTGAGANNLTISTANGSIIDIKGISLKSGNDFLYNGDNVEWNLEDLTLELEDTGSAFLYFNETDAIFNLIGVAIIFNASTQLARIGKGAVVNCDNLTLSSAGSYFFINYGTGLGGLHIKNSNLSAFTGDIMNPVGVTADSLDVTLIRVKLNTATDLLTIAPYYNGQYAKASSISNNTDYDTYHYFKEMYYTGTIQESISSFRDDGATYDGITGFSAEFIPNSNVVEYTQPLIYELGNYEVDLTVGATLTFHILINDATAQATALTNSECWLEATHPDATDLALGVTVSTIATTILTTPTTLNASTQGWTGEGSFTRKHQISVTLPTVAMVGAPVSVKLCLAKDITAENANEMFVCPDPIVT